MSYEVTAETANLPRKEALRQAYGVFRWLWREVFSLPARIQVRWFLACVAGVTIFQTIQARCLSPVFSGLVAGNRQSIIWGLVGLVVALFLQRYLDYKMNVCREWIIGLTWGSLDDCMTSRFFEKSCGQHSRFSSRLSASHMHKARERVMSLENLVLFEALPAVAGLFFSLIFLWVLSPLAGTVITLVLGGNVLWMLVLNRQVLVVCGPIEEDFRALGRRRNERWRAVDRVKTCGSEVTDRNAMHDWYGRIIEKDRSFWLWFIRMSSIRGAVNIIALTVVLVWGVYLVFTKQWTIGLLYPLWSWSFKVIDNLWAIGRLEHQVNWNLPSVRAMIEALSIPPDVVDRENAIVLHRNGPVAIEFQNVSHAYTDEEGRVSHPILRNVTFTIEPGEKVALIGKSGVGKTTLMRLLLRFMNPVNGTVRIAGHDIRDIAQTSWMHLLGYIPQRPEIFEGTIRENLLYGLSCLPPEDQIEITEAELLELMQSLQIDFDGGRLIDGLETRLGEEGAQLSGGQAQRVMIGAAVVKRPRFILIDEATSSLDSTTERLVQTGIAQALTGDVSALIVAHRLSTVEKPCTKFVVLRNAKDVVPGESQVEAIGSSFEELYRISPTFRQLADDQGIGSRLST
jgi:ABC-type multidrug transport system fused ATPase/permease subunit